MRERPERDDSVGVEQRAEEDRGVPAHRLPDGDHPARADEVDQPSERPGDLVDVVAEARDASVIPGVGRVADQDPIEAPAEGNFELFGPPEEVEQRRFAEHETEGDDQGSIDLDPVDQAADLGVPAGQVEGGVGQLGQVRRCRHAGTD